MLYYETDFYDTCVRIILSVFRLYTNKNNIEFLEKIPISNTLYECDYTFITNTEQSSIKQRKLATVGNQYSDLKWGIKDYTLI